MADRPQVAKVLEIPTANVDRNPHNPRRLFDEGPMAILKESVEKLGILVPLTVYERPGSARAGTGHYIILDGERRWRVALELQRATVPAIVVEEPDETQNILTMFHIHNVREGWQLMPTALKLQSLMDSLNETNERKLTELTKLSIPQIRRSKILLTYPKKYQEMMLAPVSDRMKADFFIELDRIRRPARSDRFAPWIAHGDSKVIQIMLNKYEATTIKAVTEFRRLAEVYRASTTAIQKKKLHAEFERFLHDPKCGIYDINVPGATFARESKEIQRSAKRLLSQVTDATIEAIAADKQTVSLLKSLMVTIKRKLDEGLLVKARDDD